MALWTPMAETSIQSSWIEEPRQMKRKSSVPEKATDPTSVATSRHRPFTRLDHNSCATTEEFDRECMGIAAKE
jgi:hypothetical protein